MKKKKADLRSVHTRLFAEDVATLKRRAEEIGIPWQIQLRTIVHKAVSEQQVSILEIVPRG